MSDSKAEPWSVSVAVICMSGAEHLARCLQSLRAQRDVSQFEIVVACAPDLPGIDSCSIRFPEARIIVNAGQESPLELASLAIRECRGRLVLVTKDHCVPDAGWVRAMVDAQRPDRSVVGGRIEVAGTCSATEWAHYYVDFFRYTDPVADGPIASLSVCNASYQRHALDLIGPSWQSTFMESAVNASIRDRVGPLWLCAGSEVVGYRPIALRDAIRERYAYGRIFGQSRLPMWGAGRRVAYALLAPVLPIVLLTRMVRAALASPRHRGRLVRAFGPLALMVLARCWGEWLAYVTGRGPRTSAGHGPQG